MNKCIIQYQTSMFKILSTIYSAYLCDFQGYWLSVLQLFYQKVWLHLTTKLNFQQLWNQQFRLALFRGRFMREKWTRKEES